MPFSYRRDVDFLSLSRVTQLSRLAILRPRAINGAELEANEKAPFFRTAPFRRGLHFNGGAGIRTPVREKIDHSVYVRVPLIEVSSRWPMDSLLLDKSSKFSPTTGG